MMSLDYKNIHIGTLIQKLVEEKEIEVKRICYFMKCSEDEVQKMFNEGNLSTEILLKWSKLLDYDFFRIYSQHLILFSPPTKMRFIDNKQKKSALPQFRKNIYTIEIIEFMLQLLDKDIKTRAQIISEYNIPKTTLYKWISKYGISK